MAAKTLKRIALGLTAFFGLFASLFIVGETFADPGGWLAVGLVSLWFVPLVVASVLAWRLPSIGVWVLGLAVGAMVSLSLWAAVDSEAWRTFEDSHGPARAIAAFALAIPIVALGWNRPLAAGVMLIVMILSPALFLVVSPGAGVTSAASTLLASPLLVIAVLLVIAGLYERDDSKDRAADQAGFSSLV